MASEASLWNGPKGKRSADLLIAFVLVALLFSFGEVSAQEVRSGWEVVDSGTCLLYTSPSPRDVEESRMPSSA